MSEPLIQSGGYHLPPGTQGWFITDPDAKRAAWCELRIGDGWVTLGPDASWHDIIAGRAPLPPLLEVAR